jgi:branched-chain amino acid transport system ATP-binding protein
MLEINHLSAGYGKLTILHHISLRVAAGQFVALLGPNGSGKSTLLKSIFGLADIFAGEIRLSEVNLCGLPTERISQQGIAYVPQRQNLFPSLTVRENLLLAARRLATPAASDALQRAYELFPILSGGERQMVAIALGWLAQPKIRLLDEPSAGLSPRFVGEVFQTLQRLAQQGLTLVVVEQNARSILRWCEYAYILREGQLVFQGDAATILADEGTVKGYLGVHTVRPSSLVPSPPSPAQP